MAITKLTIISIFELILTCVCIGLHYHSFIENDILTLMLISGTFCGYLLILIAACAADFMSAPFDKKIDIFLALLGFVLFVASGALAIHSAEAIFFKGKTYDIAISKGVIALVTGVVFLFDAFVTWRGVE